MIVTRKRVVFVCFCLCLVFFFSNAVFQPQELIVWNVRSSIPIGSDKDRVMDYLDDDLIVSRGDVILFETGWRSPDGEVFGSLRWIVPFDHFLFVRVYLILVFDENDELVAIKTHKEADLF